MGEARAMRDRWSKPIGAAIDKAQPHKRQQIKTASQQQQHTQPEREARDDSSSSVGEMPKDMKFKKYSDPNELSAPKKSWWKRVKQRCSDAWAWAKSGGTSKYLRDLEKREYGYYKNASHYRREIRRNKEHRQK